MGHCLTSKQQHLADTIALSALKVLKAILTEIFSTGEVQVRFPPRKKVVIIINMIRLVASPLLYLLSKRKYVMKCGIFGAMLYMGNTSPGYWGMGHRG